jgi:flagella basal body P-ring formation protein FlgA
MKTLSGLPKLELIGAALFLMWVSVASAAEVPLSFEVARERLHQAIVEKLPSGFRVEVESVFLNEPAPMEARMESITPNPPLGNVSFEVTWSNADGFRHTFGTASVKGYAKVAVSKLPIQNNEAFTPANTLFEEREVTPFLNRGYYTEWDDLRPLRARGYVRMGMVLGAHETQLPWLIIQGQTVDLSYRRGAISIVAKVKAKENGHKGDWIRVENTSSRKILQARIVSSGEVEAK